MAFFKKGLALVNFQNAFGAVWGGLQVGEEGKDAIDPGLLFEGLAIHLKGNGEIGFPNHAALVGIFGPTRLGKAGLGLAMFLNLVVNPVLGVVFLESIIESLLNRRSSFEFVGVQSGLKLAQCVQSLGDASGARLGVLLGFLGAANPEQTVTLHLILALSQIIVIGFGLRLTVVFAGKEVNPFDLFIPYPLTKVGVLFASARHDANEGTAKVGEAIEIFLRGQLGVGHINKVGPLK